MSSWKATAAAATLLLFGSACSFRLQKLDSAGTASEEGLLAGALSATPSYDSVNRLVLQPKCLQCHASEAPLLSSYEQVRANLESIQAVTLGARTTMPPSGPLSGLRADLLRRWIEAGAPLLGDTVTAPAPPSGPSGVLRPVTYAQVREAVFAESCADCHRPGNPDGLTDLTTYEGIMSQAGTVFAYTIMENSMPPADDAGRTPFTQEQRDLLSLWFSDGLRP